MSDHEVSVNLAGALSSGLQQAMSCLLNIAGLAGSAQPCLRSRRIMVVSPPSVPLCRFMGELANCLVLLRPGIPAHAAPILWNLSAWLDVAWLQVSGSVKTRACCMVVTCADTVCFCGLHKKPVYHASS